jgi:hypothetical protein
MKCPHCGNNIPLYKVKTEFECAKCRSLLRCDNYNKTMLIGLAVYLAITFVLDFFSSHLLTIILYNIVIFFVVMMSFSKRLDCAVHREGAKN